MSTPNPNIRTEPAKLEILESFTEPEHLYNLLTFTRNFYEFLNTVKNVKGASFKVLVNGETIVTLNGKPVIGTKSDRFLQPDNLQALLNFSGL